MVVFPHEFMAGLVKQSCASYLSRMACSLMTCALSGLCMCMCVCMSSVALLCNFLYYLSSCLLTAGSSVAGWAVGLGTIDPALVVRVRA